MIDDLAMFTMIRIRLDSEDQRHSFQEWGRDLFAVGDLVSIPYITTTCRWKENKSGAELRQRSSWQISKSQSARSMGYDSCDAESLGRKTLDVDVVQQRACETCWPALAK